MTNQITIDCNAAISATYATLDRERALFTTAVYLRETLPAEERLAIISDYNDAYQKAHLQKKKGEIQIWDANNAEVDKLKGELDEANEALKQAIRDVHEFADDLETAASAIDLGFRLISLGVLPVA